jgi:hypothetical protein
MTTEEQKSTIVNVDVSTPKVEVEVKVKKKKLTDRACKSIYNKAHHAGIQASKKCKPTPMIVGTPTTPFGNDIDTSKTMYYVEGGVCGFAWIEIRPARGKFVQWLKKNDIGGIGYYGGWQISVFIGTQSLERNEAYARAFAQVLRDNGIESARMNSRID